MHGLFADFGYRACVLSLGDFCADGDGADGEEGAGIGILYVVFHISPPNTIYNYKFFLLNMVVC